MQIKLLFLFMFLCQFLSLPARNIDNDTESFLHDQNGRPYICYNFGFSNLNTILIFDNDSICDVIIIDRNIGQTVKKTIGKTPILSWAFNEMPYDLYGTEYHITKKYQSPYFELTYGKNYGEYIDLIVESSYQRIANDDLLCSHLENLRIFLIELWSTNVVVHGMQYDFQSN